MRAPNLEVVNASAGKNPIYNSIERFPLDGLNDLLRVLIEGVDDAMFEKYVMNNPGHFYRELNTLFIEKGVLPGFKAEQECMKQTTRFMANRIRQNPENTDANSLLAMAFGAAGTTGMAADVAGCGNLFAALHQAVADAGIAAGVAGTGVADAVQGGGAVGGDFVAALSNLQNTSIPSQPLTAIDPQNSRAM